ncbi:hypothetical protein BDQ12DRAFT_726162 [Crucibulum laeve]|uniref:Uncharacterized protein n=1 Tax=Crucibulum laeve TaxID=68775 RepID=A0A5C3LT05_9AGAR|nr:hypothetical protein BDQ12DRAFT_726162 [Crucibulum laeve]
MGNLDANTDSRGSSLLLLPSQPRLTPEIILRIIDELGCQPRKPDNVSTLNNLASVSKRCHFGARKHIFSSINLSCSTTHRGAAEYKLYHLMTLFDTQPDIPSFIHTLRLCPLWKNKSYLQEVNRFIKTLVPLRRLEYLHVTCDECSNNNDHFYNDPSNQDICSTLPHLFRMPSIIELDLGSLYDPKFEILISLLTTHSHLTGLKLGDLIAGDSRNLATREYPTGSICTLTLGEDSVTDIVDLATNCGAQMFGSIKQLMFENSQAALIIENEIDIIHRLIHALTPKIPRFTWDPAPSDEFPESHISIDLHNDPSSKSLTLNFLPALAEDEEDEEDEEEEDDDDETRFNFIVFGLLENVATAVTIDELKIWFHDGCFESGFVDRIPALFWTQLDSTLSESPFLELQRLIFSIPGAETKSCESDGDATSGEEKLVRAISRDLPYVNKSKVEVSIRYS